jgi:hypothetical protein
MPSLPIFINICFKSDMFLAMMQNENDSRKSSLVDLLTALTICDMAKGSLSAVMLLKSLFSRAFWSNSSNGG